jgi:histidine triad (HIT) family protein
MTTDCIFCNIVNGKTDTEFLFENETLVVFKDIKPHAPVHLLLVPKKHIRSINDLTPADDAIVLSLISVGKHLANEVGIAASGYKLVFNVERGGGQVIFHLHLHLLGGWKP